MAGAPTRLPLCPRDRDRVPEITGFRTPFSTWTSKISSTPEWNSSSATWRPELSSTMATPHFSSSRRSATGTPPNVEVSRILRQTDDCHRSDHRQSSRVARQLADDLGTSRLVIDGHQPPATGIEEPDPALVDARRVRHREPASDRCTARDIDQAAARRLTRTPALRRVCLGHRGDIPGPAFLHRQAIQMASILGRQRRNKRRPPARHEAVLARRACTGRRTPC